MIKRLLFITLSLFLMYRTYWLVYDLWQAEPGEYDAMEAFILAFLISLFETGIFAFPGFVLPTSRWLPDRYYRIHNPGRLKYMYRILGVRYFRQCLIVAFWGHRANRAKYFSGRRSGIPNLIYQANQSEFGHLGAALLITLTGISLLFKGYFVLVAWLFFINVLGNVYPIILQRFHRLRIAQLQGQSG